MPEPNGRDRKPSDTFDPQIEHIRNETRPDFSKPLSKSKLPKYLQDTLDDDEKLLDVLYEGKAAESTDTNVRYAGYAARIRTILGTAHRYVAYTSDIGESFRPVAHPYLVKGAYGISWLYIGGDVAHEGYKAYIRQEKVLHPEKRTEEDEQHVGLSRTMPPGLVPAIDDYRAVMAQRAVFQSIASMGLPAFTIHSVVRYSAKALKNVKNVKLRSWGPIGLGLAAVPALPYMFDHPIEQATEWVFHNAFRVIGGPGAVGEIPKAIKATQKEKEL